MRTNIERAINDLILSNKDITLENALPAYIVEAGFEKMSADALIAFEHALDKYPTRRDKSRAVFVNGISRITTEYWSNKSAVLDDIGCTYCDACARRLLYFRAEAKGHCYGRPEGEEEEEKKKAPKRRCRSLCTTVLMGVIDVDDPLVKSRKGRRVHAERDAVTVRFDPYAPSTSTVML